MAATNVAHGVEPPRARGREQLSIVAERAPKTFGDFVTA